MTTTQFFFLILAIITLYAIIAGVRLRHYIRIGNALADSAVAYTQSPAQPTAHVLFLGDSSAVGVGASTPALSVPGRLGADYPHIAIENIAVSGAKVADAAAQLPTASRDNYDAIIIQVGGNDIVRFTNLEQSAQTAQELVSQAQQLSDTVIILHSGNVGTSRIFPLPIRYLYQRRTLQLRASYQQLAQQDGVYYVDIFRDAPADPFATDPSTYYAADFFHPGDAGYADWYTLIHTVLLTTPAAQLSK